MTDTPPTPPTSPGPIPAAPLPLLTPATVQLSVMMFFQFFVWGAWYVTLNPFMNAHQMSPNQIGTAYSLGPLAAIISPFFLGIVADRFFPTQRVLAVMHLLGGLFILAAPTAAKNSPDAFLAVILAHMLCYMPTLGLSNTLALHNISSPEKQFPLIRVFGTIGWIVSNLVISAMGADKSANMFYVAGAAAFALGLYSVTLPHTPPPARGKAVRLRDILGLDSLALLRSPSFFVFVLCSFLTCIPLAAYYSFAGEYAGAVGFKRIAATMSIGQMSEIFFMLIMPLMFARLGVKKMLLVGMLAWVVRYALFSAAWDPAGGHALWMVLGGIFLHGICYDFFFVTGQIHVDKQARPEIRAQAQGFLVLVTQGLGLGIGAKVIGAVVGRYTPEGSTIRNWQSIWLVPCIAAAIVTIIFFLFFREGRSTSRPPHHIDAHDSQSPGSARPARIDTEHLRDLAMLGLDESATEADVREAYRRLVKVHHPDRFESQSAEAVKAQNISFRRIQEAYERLIEFFKS